MPKAFISYSHDSDNHRERVLALSERLRDGGIETLIDQYENGTPLEGWPRWMLNQLDAANFVLVVCTETYYRRFRGHEVPGKGKGADWEGALITQEVYDARSRTLKFVPVLFEADAARFIPEPLRAVTNYTLTSEVGYSGLYDFLLGQSGVEPRAVGTPKIRPRRTVAPLTFGEPAESASTAGRYDISRITKYAPAELIGRDGDLQTLSDAWAKTQNHDSKRPRVLTFVALGGEGKTSLVAKWAAKLAAEDWRGCDAAFAWSFYSQGVREQLAASSDLFLKEALTFFGDDADKAFAASPAGSYEKGQRLAHLVGQRRGLLILDGLEPLQYPPTPPHDGALKDQGITALLKALAANSSGLCIVTTRYSLPDLKAFRQTTAPEVKLLRLSRDAGVHLLKTIGVRGTSQEFATLVEDVKGHALTLTLLGGFLARAFHGDIRQRDRVRFDKADEKIDGGHALRTMAAYEQWLLSGDIEGRRQVAVLRLMGLFDRPADADCLRALRREPIAGLTEPLDGMEDDDWEYCLSGLEAARLLTVNRDDDATDALVSLDAHPHIRTYFAKQLSEKHPDAWRAAHRRLYEHLCTITPDRTDPTLEDLQPLYQAVAHGCQAGLWQKTCDDVLYARIRQGNKHYSSRRLGAYGSDLGAFACFFVSPWKHVSTEISKGDQAWIASNAAFALRALGRVMEALEPMRAGLEERIAQKNWNEAAIVSSNLSELKVTLGEVTGAIRDAELAVTYADRSDNEFHRLSKRATRADALHLAGRRAEAETHFREAEQMQKARQPALPLLYSLPGFRYCDLLLAGPEHAAWQISLDLNSQPSTLNLLDSCRSVSERAAQTLEWEEGMPLAPMLDFALHHLTLGSAALYEAILAGGAADQPHRPRGDRFETARRELEAAVTGFRRASTTDHIPRGLLSRAWLRHIAGASTGPDSAQADLDDAWEIAERGPMRLFMAEIHLHRARLFFRDATYPWDSPAADLAAARKLIERCGYGRRIEELEDAEAAILQRT